MTAENELTLLVRRRIRATPERLFEAWTTPARLLRWWGPHDVECIAAQADLRVGGRYRLGNRMPDGGTIWIEGEFERIEPPRLLIFSWRLAHSSIAAERVTVRFEPRAEATEVIVMHERISDAVTRERHLRWWRGCLDKLACHAAPDPGVSPATSPACS